MPRQLPKEWRDETVKIPDLTPKTDQYITQVREYELITPLFGGGVETQKADPITVVRATEVRGQLRFWWRATRGGQFGGSLEKMKKAEDALWGSTTEPSAVQIEVVIEKRGSPLIVSGRDGRPINNWDGDNISAGDPKSPYSYGAFPLFSQPGKTLQEKVIFKIALMFPQDSRIDIEAALWAWEAFGGVGARTRRGFGAIRYISSQKDDFNQPPSDHQGATQWLRDSLKQHVASGIPPRYVPYLTIDSMFVLTKSLRDCDLLWREKLLDRLKAFRHQRERKLQWRRGRDRNSRPERKSAPGKNHWPEPDAIRRRAKRWANYTERVGPTGQQEENIHDHQDSTATSQIDAFPRAAFGLPIQFGFKEDDQRNGLPKGNNNSPGDPGGTNLLRGVKSRHENRTEYYERLASPLILRPLACRDGQYIGIAIRLAGSELPEELEIGIELNRNTNVLEIARCNIRTQLTLSEAETIPEFTEFHNDGRKLVDTPLLRRVDNTITTDVIEAFLAYMERKER